MHWMLAAAAPGAHSPSVDGRRDDQRQEHEVVPDRRQIPRRDLEPDAKQELQDREPFHGRHWIRRRNRCRHIAGNNRQRHAIQDQAHQRAGIRDRLPHREQGRECALQGLCSADPERGPYDGAGQHRENRPSGVPHRAPPSSECLGHC